MSLQQGVLLFVLFAMASGIDKYPPPMYEYPPPPPPKYPPKVEKAQPYDFSYDFLTKDGASVWQQEQGGDNGDKSGTYGYKDAYGVYRYVDYWADANGFRAKVKTNEPGTANANPADVVIEMKETPKYTATAAPSKTPYPPKSYEPPPKPAKMYQPAPKEYKPAPSPKPYMPNPPPKYEEQKYEPPKYEAVYPPPRYGEYVMGYY